MDHTDTQHVLDEIEARLSEQRAILRFMPFADVAETLRAEVAELEDSWEEALTSAGITDPMEGRVMLLEAQSSYLMHQLADLYGRENAGILGNDLDTCDWTRGQNTIFHLLDTRKESLRYALNLLEGEVAHHDEQMAEWETLP